MLLAAFSLVNFLCCRYMTYYLSQCVSAINFVYYNYVFLVFLLFVGNVAYFNFILPLP